MRNKICLLFLVVLLPIMGKAAMNFDATDDFVDFGDVLEPVRPITLSAWVRPAVTVQVNYATIVAKDYSFPRAAPYVTYKLGGYSAGTGKYTFEIATGTIVTGPAILEATSGPIANELVHLCGTYDGSTMRIYVNGVEQNSRSISGNLFYSNGYLRFGANAAGAELWQGTIDDVRVYSRALSSAEVASLGLSRLRLNITDSLQGWWRLDGGVNNVACGGATVVDTMGSGLTGTCNGNPTWISSVINYQ